MNLSRVLSSRVPYRFTKIKGVFLFIILAFQMQFLLAQQVIDSLRISTDGQVNSLVIDGDHLFLGGRFQHIGKRIGPVAFFKDGKDLPDYTMPHFGST